jgi:cyclopropane fatty-acyl-phospholipid synthase-like methyltransferase
MLSVCQDNGYEQSTGMDLSLEQVNMAKDFGVKGVEHGDALVYLKETTEKYDVILGMDIIEHFTKDELVELLIALRGCLTPNGRLIIRTPNLDAPFATVFANGDFTHENYMNVSSAQQVMMACGFQKVSVNASDMSIDNPIKELIRRFAFWELKILYKWQLFATGRSTRDVLFSPNMIIIAQNG